MESWNLSEGVSSHADLPIATFFCGGRIPYFLNSDAA
jgi:hypothetical protein